jgi:limonene-1,2-epoxide hydrolase
MTVVTKTPATAVATIMAAMKNIICEAAVPGITTPPYRWQGAGCGVRGAGYATDAS